MVGKARRAYFFWLAIIVKTKVVKEVAVLTTLSQVPTLLLGLMPVSYTHLDVYKRQGHLWLTLS